MRSRLAWRRDELYTHRFGVTLAADVAMSTKPYFSRKGLQESRYTLSDPSQFGRPASAPPLVAVARYTVGGVPVEIRETVKRREAKLPYGDVLREVRSVPRLAVMISPTNAVVPLSAATKRVDVESLAAAQRRGCRRPGRSRSGCRQDGRRSRRRNRSRSRERASARRTGSRCGRARSMRRATASKRWRRRAARNIEKATS